MMAGEIVLCQNDDGTIRLETRLENETLRLTQQQMAELFQTSKQNISHHIRSIYAEWELTAEATVKEYLTVQKEGARGKAKESKGEAVPIKQLEYLSKHIAKRIPACKKSDKK